MVSLYAPLLLACGLTQVSSECCEGNSPSDFCIIFKMLSSSEQAEVKQHLGDDCEGDVDEAAGKIEKRKPNFIRFGRAVPSAAYGKKGADPNFLRFGRAAGRSTDPNFLRFGRSTEPNFLRFGKRAEMNEPNFLRFGRNNFLRFGREYDDEFNRQDRKPNFLRFGR